MGSVVISHLGKAYKAYPNKWRRLAEWASPIRLQLHELKWVLRDISMKVGPGEALGILGLNGAGKSTLLKIICGTTLPTTGSIKISGRISALLELGLGFHPDFTGRQNLFLAGQLLGMGMEQITQLQPEIEEFAEIGRFIDEPLRVYSSGMQVRLAFSLATALRPDILIVDEALSVGDIYFQHKCLDRIKQFIKEGTTLLMVSHDTAAIQAICSRAVLLKDGSIEADGTPEEVVNVYNAIISTRGDQAVERVEMEIGDPKKVKSGTGEISLRSVVLVDQFGIPHSNVMVGQNVRLKLELIFSDSLKDVTIGFLIKNHLGISIFGTNTSHLGAKLESANPGDQVDLFFDFQATLGPGKYSISIAAHGGQTHLEANYFWQDHAIVFDVVNGSERHFVGLAWLPTQVTLKKWTSNEIK